MHGAALAMFAHMAKSIASPTSQDSRQLRGSLSGRFAAHLIARGSCPTRSALAIGHHRTLLHEPRKAIVVGRCDDTEFALSIALHVVTLERWPQAPWPLRAKNRLIADHVWICEKIAKKYRGEAEEDDLQQEGTFGLYKALRKFDPRSGNKFSTLAWRAVEWAIKDYLKRLRPLQRHQSSDEIAASGDGGVLGIYARNSVEPGDEHKLIRQLFEKSSHQFV